MMEVFCLRRSGHSIMGAAAIWATAIIVLAVTAARGAGVADLRVERASNRGVVQLMTGSTFSASIRLIEDLSAIFDDGTTRRLLPVVGRGALQNLSDLTSLRGIDMAILQADVVDGVRRQRGMPGIENSFTDRKSVV